MNYRILIVEDDTLVADAIERALVKSGHTVVGQAADYDRAVALLEDTQPELLLLDIDLLGPKTGLDVADYIRRQQLDVAFIFLTAKTGGPYIQRAKELLPAGYLPKPFQPRAVVATIEVAMFKSHRQTAAAPTHLPLSNGTSTVRQKVDDIAYIVPDEVYARIYRRDGTFFLHRSSLSELEKKFADYPFLRVHRSYLVNLAAVESWDRYSVRMLGQSLPVSRSKREELVAGMDQLNTRGADFGNHS